MDKECQDKPQDVCDEFEALMWLNLSVLVDFTQNVCHLKSHFVVVHQLDQIPFFLNFDRHRVEQAPHLVSEESFVFGDALLGFVNDCKIVLRLLIWILDAYLFSNCSEVSGGLTLVLDNYRLVLPWSYFRFSENLFFNVVLINHDFWIQSDFWFVATGHRSWCSDWLELGNFFLCVGLEFYLLIVLVVAAVVLDKNTDIGFIWYHLRAVCDFITSVPDPLACLVQDMRKFFEGELYKVYLALITALYSIQNALVSRLKLFDNQINVVYRRFVFTFRLISF